MKITLDYGDTTEAVDIIENARSIISLLSLAVPLAIPLIGMKLGVYEDSKGYGVTDSVSIGINKKFWWGLQKEEKMGMLLKVWLQIAGFHPSRMTKREYKPWNLASNLVVGSMIMDNRDLFGGHIQIKLPPGMFFDQNYTNKSVEEAHLELITERDKRKQQQGQGQGKQQKQQQQGQGQKQGQKQKGKNQYNDFNDAVDILMDQNAEGEGGGSFDLEAPPSDFDETDMKNKIISAADMHKKSRGNLPAYYERLVLKLRQSKAPWEKILANLVKEVVYFGGNRSFERPKRWAFALDPMPIIPGEISKKTKTKIIIIYDTSGSISENELSTFNSEVAKILKLLQCTLTVITCDAAVHEEVKISKLAELSGTGGTGKLKYRGGGGTDFRPALKRAADLKPDLTIYFTDGYGDFGNQPKIRRLLWVMTTDVKAPFGKTVCIKD